MLVIIASAILPLKLLGVPCSLHNSYYAKAPRAVGLKLSEVYLRRGLLTVRSYTNPSGATTQ